MPGVRALLRNICPESLRRGWWYLSDPKWRAQYRTAQLQFKVNHELQKQAHVEIWEQTEGRIASGPFKGLQYGPSPGIGVFPQKLLGTYERELWPIIEEIVATPYQLIVDVGAAEGYYVCGLASRMPGTRVIAFEAQHTCHRQLRLIAAANKVADQVVVRDFCTPHDLQQAICSSERILVICDIEGGERELLDLHAVPALQYVDLLVELHENLAPGVIVHIESRFSATHKIKRVSASPRLPEDMPASIKLPMDESLAAMNEFRFGGLDWFWMTAKTA